MKQEEEVKQRDDPYQELLMDPGELLNNIKETLLRRKGKNKKKPEFLRDSF